jgi:hypothetical protein
LRSVLQLESFLAFAHLFARFKKLQLISAGESDVSAVVCRRKSQWTLCKDLHVRHEAENFDLLVSFSGCEKQSFVVFWFSTLMIY